MGLFTKLKRFFNKTIEIMPYQRGNVVSFVRFRRGLIKIGAEVVVDENYNFVIVRYNRVCDILTQGSHRINEATAPKLCKFSKSFLTKKGLIPKRMIKADAYFIYLNPIRLNFFKTPERIVVFENGHKAKIKLEGTFSFKVIDSRKLMRALCNDYAIIRNKKTMKEIKATVGYDISKILNQKKYSLSDYLNKNPEITEILNKEIQDFVENFGLEVSEIVINTVILPRKYNAKEIEKEEDKDKNIDIVSLVEERLNDLEKNFVTVDARSGDHKDQVVREKFFNEQEKIDNQIKIINNSSISPQGDIKIDVVSNDNSNNVIINSNYQEEPIIITPNYSQNQKEPSLFEENVKNVNEENTHKQNLKKEELIEDVVGNAELTKKKLKTKKCIACGEVLESEAKFCNKCGVAQEGLKICPCCGAKNFPSATTCCVCKSDL